MPYRYALLAPSRSEDASEINEPFLAEPCFGIEVTEAELAARCTLGNLDPQHSGGKPDVAAIEAALEAPLPPFGSTLVTLRPDADAYGAMGVLTLRARNHSLSSEARLRIDLVGSADRFNRGTWPGRQPLFSSGEPGQEPCAGSLALQRISALIADRRTQIGDGVRAVMNWIELGHLQVPVQAAIAGGSEELRRRVADGEVKIYEALPLRIAVVEGAWPALTLGYRLAPIVVAVNPSFGVGGGPTYRKITIAQYEPRWVNLSKVLSDLTVKESGWGGSKTIIGSPQGIDCRSSLQECIDAVVRHLEVV